MAHQALFLLLFALSICHVTPQSPFGAFPQQPQQGAFNFPQSGQQQQHSSSSYSYTRSGSQGQQLPGAVQQLGQQQTSGTGSRSSYTKSYSTSYTGQGAAQQGQQQQLQHQQQVAGAFGAPSGQSYNWKTSTTYGAGGSPGATGSQNSMGVTANQGQTGSSSYTYSASRGTQLPGSSSSAGVPQTGKTSYSSYNIYGSGGAPQGGLPQPGQANPQNADSSFFYETRGGTGQTGNKPQPTNPGPQGTGHSYSQSYFSTSGGQLPSGAPQPLPQNAGLSGGKESYNYKYEYGITQPQPLPQSSSSSNSFQYSVYGHGGHAQGGGLSSGPNGKQAEETNTKHVAEYVPPMYGPHPETYYTTHTSTNYHPVIPGYSVHGHQSSLHGAGGAQPPLPKSAHGVYAVQDYGYSVPYIYGHTQVYHAAPPPPPPVMAVTYHYGHHHAPPPPTGIPGYSAMGAYHGQHYGHYGQTPVGIPGFGYSAMGYGQQTTYQHQPPMGQPGYSAMGYGQHSTYQQQPQPPIGQPGYSALGYGHQSTYQHQPQPSMGQPGYPAMGYGHQSTHQQQPQPPTGQAGYPAMGYGQPPPRPSQHFVPNPPPSGHTAGGFNSEGKTYYPPAYAPPGTGHTSHTKPNRPPPSLPTSLKGPPHYHNYQGPHRREGLAPTHFYEKHRYVETASQHVCQDQTLRLECPHDEGNRYLHIVGAYFGRGNTHDCPHSSRYMRNTHCRADLSQFKVVHACEAKTSCEIPATVDFFSNDFLGDPCEGTHKYLKIFYECRYEKPKECDTKDVPYKDAYACEGQPLVLECPNEGEVIKVLDANFGRQGSDMCDYQKGDDLACDSNEETYEMVCLSCRGKHECEIPATAELFGDNCPGTNKYLSVRYRCFDPLTEDEEAPSKGHADITEEVTQERGRPKTEKIPGVEEDEKDTTFGGVNLQPNQPVEEKAPVTGSVTQEKDDKPLLPIQPVGPNEEPTIGHTEPGGDSTPRRGRKPGNGRGKKPKPLLGNFNNPFKKQEGGMTGEISQDKSKPLFSGFKLGGFAGFPVKPNLESTTDQGSKMDVGQTTKTEPTGVGFSPGVEPETEPVRGGGTGGVGFSPGVEPETEPVRGGGTGGVGFSPGVEPELEPVRGGGSGGAEVKVDPDTKKNLNKFKNNFNSFKPTFFNPLNQQEQNADMGVDVNKKKPLGLKNFQLGGSVSSTQLSGGMTGLTPQNTNQQVNQGMTGSVGQTKPKTDLTGFTQGQGQTDQTSSQIGFGEIVEEEEVFRRGRPVNPQETIENTQQPNMPPLSFSLTRPGVTAEQQNKYLLQVSKSRQDKSGRFQFTLGSSVTSQTAAGNFKKGQAGQMHPVRLGLDVNIPSNYHELSLSYIFNRHHTSKDFTGTLEMEPFRIGGRVFSELFQMDLGSAQNTERGTFPFQLDISRNAQSYINYLKVQQIDKRDASSYVNAGYSMPITILDQNGKTHIIQLPFSTTVEESGVKMEDLLNPAKYKQTQFRTNFKMVFNGNTQTLLYMPFTLFEQGNNKYVYLTATTCAMLKSLGYEASDEYIIDPDEVNTGEPPFGVYCDMESGKTVISHNLMEFETVDTSKPRYEKVIDYKLTNAQLIALRTTSEGCTQEIERTCTGSLHWSSSTPLVWWESLDGTQRNYWGGVASTATGCDCGQRNPNACARKGDKCNCDIGNANPQKDYGSLEEKDHLPVKKIVDTDATRGSSQLKLGEFECFGDSKNFALQYWHYFFTTATGAQRNCAEHFKNKVTANGLFYIDPDSVSGNVLPFIVYCDKMEEQTDASAVQTVITHDAVVPIQVQGGASYSHDLLYTTYDLEMDMLIRASKECKQTVEIVCQGQPRVKSEVTLGRNNAKCTCFTDCQAAKSKIHSCQCAGLPGASGTLRGGFVQVNNPATEFALPIRQIKFPNTAGSIKYNIGRLECTGTVPLSAADNIPVAKTCKELKDAGKMLNGMYLIDPDGSFFKLPPFPVFCDMTNGGKTIVNHNFPNQEGYAVMDYEDPGSFERDIHYGAPVEQLIALAGESSSCSQDIRYTCLRSVLFDGTTPYGWWEDRNGNQMLNFGTDTGHTGCACSKTKSCAGQLCNCDANDGTIRKDGGSLTDKDTLPVTGVYFGDVSGDNGPELAQFSLGPLICEGDGSAVQSGGAAIGHADVQQEVQAVRGGSQSTQAVFQDMGVPACEEYSKNHNQFHFGWSASLLPGMDRLTIGLRKSTSPATLTLAPDKTSFGSRYEIEFSQEVVIRYCKAGSVECNELGRMDMGTFSPTVETTIWMTYDSVGLTVGRDRSNKVLQVANGDRVDVQEFGVKGNGATWRFLTFCAQQLLVCGGGYGEMSCGSNGFIDIQYALYGRLMQSTACGARKTETTDCKSQAAYAEVLRQCQGRRKCRVYASSQTFSDPCPNTHKYADVRFRCIAKKVTRSVGGACLENPCMNEGLCIPSGNSYKCDCSKTDFIGDRCQISTAKSWCRTYSDRHYQTFDGKFFGFEATNCAYILSKDCSGRNLYEISVSPQTDIVTVMLGIKRFELHPNGKAIVNGAAINALPFKQERVVDDHAVEIKQLGEYLLVLETTFGLRVEFDGKDSVRIRLVPEQGVYLKVCGLCGNKDGNVNNEFINQQLVQVSDANAFGNAWRRSTNCAVTPSLNTNMDTCNNANRQPIAEKNCRKMQTGVFTACYNKFKDFVTELMNDCKHDVCKDGDSKADNGHCNTFSHLAHLCIQHGFSINTWRAHAECTLECDFARGFMYNPCTPGCPKTCWHEPSGLCNEPCVDGCMCPPGFIKDVDNRCKPEDQCKKECKDPETGQVYEVDKTWITPGCRKECKCVETEGGVEISCENIQCHRDATCTNDNGKHGCQCKWTDPNNDGIDVCEPKATPQLKFTQTNFQSGTSFQSGTGNTLGGATSGQSIKSGGITKSSGQFKFSGKLNTSFKKGFRGFGGFKLSKRSADGEGDQGAECDYPLGLASGRVKNKHITALDDAGDGFEAHLARLDNTENSLQSGGWRAGPKKKPLLKIDLGRIHFVTGVATQGHPSTDMENWVTHFHVYVSKDGAEWSQMYNTDGHKGFHGNTDRNTTVINYFNPSKDGEGDAVEARYLKIEPTAWNDHAAMRMEVLGCSLQCQDKIGYPASKRSHIATDNWSVINSGNPITCNGYLTEWHYMPARSEPFQICVWRPASHTDEYVYELISCTHVRAADPDKAYKIPLTPKIPVRRGDVIGYTFMRNPLYSTEDGDGDTECLWMNNNLIKNFNELELGETVRFDSKMNSCAFSVHAQMEYDDEREVAALNCRNMLGVWDRTDIPDLHFSASSALDKTTAPHHARLSMPDSPNLGGWLPLPDDATEPWIQVDLGEMSIITGVITQGRPGEKEENKKEEETKEGDKKKENQKKKKVQNQKKKEEEDEEASSGSWVSRFFVAYSDDGFSDTIIKDEEGLRREFDGNTDADGKVFNYFKKAVRARFIRIFPLEGKGLRFEVLGCSDPNPCAFEGACENGGVCMRAAMTDPDRYVCKCPIGFSGRKCEIQGEGFCRSVSRDHFLTFDGLLYDFHGSCQYKMVVSEEFKFEVIVDNSECGREVIVKIDDMTFELKEEGRILADGEVCALPIMREGVKITMNGGMGVLLVKEFEVEGEWVGKLSVQWDGQHTVSISLSPNFDSKVDGLCGNYNGVVADDESLENILKWVVDPTTCPETQKLAIPCFHLDTDKCADRETMCTEIERKCAEIKTMCAEMKKLPLAECNIEVNPEEYIQNCIYDMYTSPPTSYSAVKCDHLEEYAAVCSLKGISIAWRTPNRCSMQCKGGAILKERGSACPATCGDAHANTRCTEPSMESCECELGLVWDTISKECVPPQDCGCQDNGCYYALGKSFNRKGCTEKCECLAGGKVVCTPVTCGKNAHCGVSQGTYECHCNDGFTGDGYTCNAIQEEKTAGTCGNKELNIRCELQVLDIIDATITTDLAKCPASGTVASVSDQCCSDDGAMLAVDRFCQGKESCTFSASSEFLGEPCIDETRYLNVKYHCTDKKEPEAEVKEEIKIGCQLESLDIDCGARYIDVTFANYGRLSENVCKPKADTAIKSTNCVHPASLAIVQSKCQGKKQCDGILVSTSTFAQNGQVPCLGTEKYLEVRYQCTEAPQEASQPKNPCSSSPCVNGECIRTAGEDGYVCQCSSGWGGKRCKLSLSTCSVLGLGHVHNFNNAPFQMYSECRHTLLQACGEEGPQFLVEVQMRPSNVERQGFSAVEEVFLSYEGTEIELGQEESLKLNGRRVNYPVNIDNGRITVKPAGAYLLVKTDFGLTISWDSHHHVKVTVPSDKASQMCGLCGHYGDERGEGYHYRDGTHGNDLLTFLAGWTSMGCPFIDVAPVASDLLATDDPDGLNYVLNECSAITEEEGVFRSCMKKVDPEAYFNICLQDMSAGYPRDLEFRCETMAAYADACLAHGIYTVSNWRFIVDCVMECPPSMTYNPLSSGCPNTCGETRAAEECTIRPHEGCECSEDSGLIREGGRCIAKEDCGCVNGGQYFPAGTTIVEEGCTRYGHCAPGNSISQWFAMKCAKNAFCGSRDNNYGCHCHERFIGNALDHCHVMFPENERFSMVSLGQTANIDCGDLFVNVMYAGFQAGNSENCDAASIIREECQDRHKCRAVVSTSNFGDGCTDVSPLLNLEYYCTPSPTYMEDQGARKLVCGSKHMEISCGHKHIKILEGSNYGRLEGSEVCGGGEILSTSCRWDGTMKFLRMHCEDKKSCSVHVGPDITEGFDPCPDTSKYMEVRYQCVEPTE